VRAGTDIAFLGGIIRHLLENDLWFKDYALDYTSIATIIDPRFRGDGKFSGWDEETRCYTFDTWQYEGLTVPTSLAEHYVNTTESFAEHTQRLTEKPVPQDRTLQHPNCVTRSSVATTRPTRPRWSSASPAAQRTPSSR
jgi:formate dehydrogenase major subunit